jgi:hypothetical protein
LLPLLRIALQVFSCYSSIDRYIINSMYPPLIFSLQALLARHEAYMADAERDRVELTTRIEQLELDKKELEAENAKTIEENRNLLDQLEMLNSTVLDSDTRIRALEASLLSSQQAARRLESTAIRATDMERHIMLLELEQQKLQTSLINSESEARSAMQRWRKAERGIADLQDQLERMEKEALEERERHVEVMGRMEKQREMEKELNTAAGRLKGAAAAKSLQSGGKNGSNVVSHFVRDLLQDNASLQLGIAELRDMLMASNDEIQALREQLLYHQPAADGEVSAASTLRAELEQPSLSSPHPAFGGPGISQEVHVHHHYHVTPKPEPRKPKKKRLGLNPGIFTPPGIGSPSTPPSASGPWRYSPSPSRAGALAHSHSHGHASRDSTSTISVPSNRWSLFSEQPSELAFSSVPSSPLSNPRYSVFDRGMPEADLPTSPTTSVDPASPTWRVPQHKKRISDMSLQSNSYHATGFAPPAPPTLAITNTIPGDEIIPQSEETPTKVVIQEDLPGESEDSAPDLTSATDDSTAEESVVSGDDEIRPKRLHRAVSHESIMSLAGGLDIHTLKSRPSQLTLRPLGGAGAVLTGVVAQPTISRSADKRSSIDLRSQIAGLPIPRMVSNPAMMPTTPIGTPQTPGGFGRWVSWRPWGGTSPSTSVASSTFTATPKPAPTPKPFHAAKEHDFFGRAPGINQPGAIPGFQQYWAAHQRRGPPSRVLPDIIDTEALREGLLE